MSNERDNLENPQDLKRTGSSERAGNSAKEESSFGAAAGAGGSSEFPPTDRAELAALLRDLDAVGAARRAQLSSEAEHRIFAASDLQLPLAQGEVRPVAGRIVPERRSAVAMWSHKWPQTWPRMWVRIAAAIAVVGSITAGAIVLSRSFDGASSDDASGPGGATSGRVIADAGNSPNAGASDGADAPATMLAVASPEHFELALAADPLRRASSLSAPAVAAALESPKRLAYPAIAPIDSSTAASAGIASMSDVGFDDDSLAGLGGIIGGIDEAIDLDFDGLSGEFAAIVSRSASGF